MLAYAALQTTVTLEGLMDIIEMKEVRTSWSHAELFNFDEREVHERALRELGGS